MNRTKTTTYNSLSLIIVMLVSYLAMFAYRTVLVKVLGNEYAGISGLFRNILSLFSLAELGMGSAITVCLYKPLASNDHEHIAALMNLIMKIYKYIGLVIMAAGLAILPFLDRIITIDTPIKNVNLIYLLFLLDSVCSYLFFSYYQVLMTAARFDYKTTVPKIVMPIVISIIQIIVIILLKSFILAVAFSLLGTLFSNIWMAVIAKKQFPFLKEYKDKKISKSERLWIIDYVKATFYYKISMKVLYSTDSIVISKFIGLAILGMYSNYILIVDTIKSLILTVVHPIGAALGDLNVSADEEYKKKMFLRLTFFNNWICLFCTVCFFVLLNPFISIWLGKESLLSKEIVALICISFYTEFMPNFIVKYRDACGLNIYGRFRPVFTAVINLIVSVLLAPKVGVAGVIIGTIISRLTTIFWFDPYIVYKKVFNQRCSEYFVLYIKNTFLLILVGNVCYFTFSLIWNGSLLSFIGGAFCVILIPNLLLLILYRKNENLLYYKSYFGSLIKRKI